MPDEVVSSAANGNRFSLLKWPELEQALPGFWFEIRGAATVLRKDKQAEDQQLLNRISALMWQKTPPESWEVTVADSFISLIVTVLHRQMARIGQNDGASVVNIQHQADLACSLAASLPQVPELARVRVAGLWSRSRLFTESPSEDPGKWLAEVVDSMNPLGLNEEAVRNHTKAQYVMRASALFHDGMLPEPVVNVAREWCSNLAGIPEFRGLIKAAAGTLKVEIPPSGELAPPAIRPIAPITQPSQSIFAVPDWLSDEATSELRKTVLFQLYAQSGVPDSLLSDQTKRQVNDILPNSRAEQIDRTFYYAGFDLWKGYWTTGKVDLLEIVRHIAHYLYTGHASEVPPNDRDKSNAVQLWVAAQLPELLLTCGIKQLVEGVDQLCRQIKTRVNDFALKEIIIQAFAGYCRHLDAEEHPDEKPEVLKEYGTDLRKIHEEYDRRTRGMERKPWITKSRQDELSAWDYLFPSEPGTSSASGRLTEHIPSDQTVKPPSPSRDKILDDPTFRNIVRGGEHYQIFDFVTQNLSDIEDLLSRRLNVKLTPANLMQPEGTIRETYGTRQRQENAQFREGSDALDHKNFSAASKVFRRLADRMDGFPRQIANSYLAYAEVRQGDTLEGRRLLNMVCESNFSFSSAYWNLACCLPSTDNRQQLEAIVKGLEFAPHPKLLDAAIYLGLFLHDDRLRVWLPCDTRTESLLLFYHLVFEDSEASERERHLMQLAAYMRNGEPSRLDPTRSYVHRPTAAAYITSLSDAQQPEAIEFWLRCRQVLFSRRFDFWEIKTDYYEKCNRLSDAALAFCEELTCRLNFLRYKLKQPKEARGNDLLQLVRGTRERSQRWLTQCMTEKLRPTGLSIYNRLRDFNEWYESICEGEGLPPILSATRRLTEFYRPEDDIPQAEAGKVSRPARNEKAKPLQPKPKVSEILTQVGAVCQKDLHEAGGLVMVRPAIENLINTLRDGDTVDAADALQKLVLEWERYDQHVTEEDKRAALDSANSSFADLKSKLNKKLTPQDFILATPFINALRRVNDRLVRDLQLLPEIIIEPVQGDLVLLDVHAPKTAIAIRIRSLATDHSGSSIRLVNARAVLDEGTELQLRDDLNLLPTYVKPGESALLTFAVDNSAALKDRGTMRVEIVYNCMGTDIHVPAAELTIGHQSCPDLPERSPYISMRMIEPDEIPEHFFGRDLEQREILASVSNGQEKIRYVEGIRRSGKSSLLNSIIHQIAESRLPLIPIYWSIAETSGVNHPGLVLHNAFLTISRNEDVSAAGVVPPDQERCISNPSEAYSEFESILAAQLPEKRILALVDDFQELIKAAAAKRERNDLTFSQGVMAILNLIRAKATTKARLLWLFSGQNAARRYRDPDMLPGCLLWATWKSLPIDFLDVLAARAIVTEPLKATRIVVPNESIERIHFLTSGHPEAIQQISEIMLNKAREERRWILTPADANAAGQQLAKENDDTFADTWFPTTELTGEQQALVASLVNAVDVGGQVELFKLAANNQVTEDLRNAQDDLVARKILSVRDDGTIGVRAPVLDLWLHRHWIRHVNASGAFNGSAAIFIDVANVTGGKGDVVLSDLETSAGEGRPGRFSLGTILDRIEGYVKQLTPAPVAARWASNYPRGCPAILVCNSKDYYNVNVPEDLHQKGSDDITLMLKVKEVEQQYRQVNHFVLVTGDKDYRELIRELLQNGHFAHVISRAASLGRTDTKYSYDRLAQEFPKRFDVVRLEELLATHRSATAEV